MKPKKTISMREARSLSSMQPKAKGEDIVVFSILRESVCAECGRELLKGDFLRMEAGHPLCLMCADLDHLVFLPRGDTALTRRASQHSTLRAVVVRFSRSRKRYERQGVLIDEQALARAEQECLADVAARAGARERATVRSDQLDQEYVKRFEERIGEIFPDCPLSERRAIAEHACQKYSGRVGRSAAAKEFDENATRLAVRAHVRHQYTRYDELLMHGVDRSEARAETAARVSAVLEQWENTRSGAA
jgi:hypothetical protein